MHLNKKIHRNTDLYVTDYENFHSKISRYLKKLFLGYQEHIYFFILKVFARKNFENSKILIFLANFFKKRYIFGLLIFK